MINKIKKFYYGVIAFCLCISLFPVSNTYAQTKNNEKMIGMVRSNIPYVQLEIKAEDASSDNISARIGSRNMELVSITPVSQQKMLTYILIDNSSSMTQDNICPSGSFEAIKNALSDFIKSNVDDNNNFSVYSIGEGDAKSLGVAQDSKTANSVSEKISALSGKEDATNLNETLNKIFDKAASFDEDYQLIKFILITDTSADYSNGVALSEAESKYQYNKYPFFTICNTAAENSTSFKELRTFCRNSGGEGVVFNYNRSNAADIIKNVYKDMRTGALACFVTDIERDNNTKELIINYNGKDYPETVLLDKAANITAGITADISVSESNDAFIVRFSQDGFVGNVPLNKAVTNNNAYVITKSGSDDVLPVNRVEKNSDGSCTVYMKDVIYTGSYDFKFNGITDLSSNLNGIVPIKNHSVEAKSRFWIFFPYLMIAAAVLVVLLVFYLILLGLKKKKNVKTIKEIFEMQVNETVEERHYVQNVRMNDSRKVNLYFQTSKYPQKHIALDIQSSIIVGRSDICDVYIDDLKMSRQHFAIEYTQGVFMITDLHAVNGTYVNGIRLQSRQRLNSGDMIVAGLTSIRIEF